MDIATREARIAHLQARIEKASTWTWLQQYVPHMKAELAAHQDMVAEQKK